MHALRISSLDRLNYRRDMITCYVLLSSENDYIVSISSKRFFKKTLGRSGWNITSQLAVTDTLLVRSK